MDSGEIVFRASRPRLAFWIVAGLLLGIVCLSPWLLVDIRAGHVTGSRSIVLLLLPPNVRVALFEVFGALMLVFSVLQLRLLLDNRLVFIDDDGIRVRGAFRTRRGYWRDFKGIRRRKIGSRGPLMLSFARSSNPVSAANTSRMVMLPSHLYGVPREPLLHEIQRRVRPVA